MNMPSFTAEASLYKTSGHYQTSSQAINLPTQMISPIYPAMKNEDINIFGCRPGLLQLGEGENMICINPSDPFGTGGGGGGGGGGGDGSGGGGGGDGDPVKPPKVPPLLIGKHCKRCIPKVGVIDIRAKQGERECCDFYCDYNPPAHCYETNCKKEYCDPSAKGQIVDRLLNL